MHAKSLQLCLTICDPMDCSLPEPLSMGFSRREYRNGLSCPPPGDLPNPGMETVSLTSLALTGRFFTTSTIWEAPPTCTPSVYSILCKQVSDNCFPVWLIYMEKKFIDQSDTNIRVKVKVSLSVVSNSFQPHGLHTPRNSPGQNTKVGSLSLLQGIFPIQGSNQVSHTAGRFFTS